MCEALSEVFHIVRPGKGDWKVFDKTLPKPSPTDVEEWVDYIKKFYRPPKNTVQVAPFPVEVGFNKFLWVYNFLQSPEVCPLLLTPGL